MKGWKEYLALFLIIAGLGGYLYFRHTDQVNYRMPKLDAVDSKNISRIVIVSRGNSITLNRKDSVWLMEPGSLAADTAKVEKILNRISGLQLTDLVSESRSYSRYEMDEMNRISVSAYEGATMVRRFDIGKTAPSSRHTFVMVQGDANVYQARDSFRDDFTSDASALRDRKVLSFAPDGIRRVTIAKTGSQAVTITRQDEPANPAGTDEKQPAPVTRWTDGTGREIPANDVISLVTSLSTLECGQYMDDREKDKMGTPEVTITMSGAKDYTLSLFPKDGNRIPAISSGSPSVFTLPEYRQDGIVKNIEMLTGKK